MRNRGILWAVALVVACGDDGQGATGETSTTSTTTPTSSTAATSSTTAASTGANTSGTGTTGTTDSGGTTGGPIFDVGDTGDDTPPPPDFPTTCEEAMAGNTSVGCIFYPAAVPAGSASNNAGFTVSNVSANVATVTLSDKNGLVDSAMVQPGEIHTFLDQGVHQLPIDTGTYGHGYVIESDEPLQVYQFIPTAATATADASIVLPEQALGIRHRVAAYNDKEPSGLRHQYAVVVATADATTVTFTLAQPDSEIEGGGGIPTLDKNSGPDSHELVLNRLDVAVFSGQLKYSVTDTLVNEITGSLVESDKPVAVYSGNDVSYLPANEGGPFNCCADLISTAVPPTTVYGKEYAGVKLLPLGQEIDLWRFLGNVDGTEIELSGGVAMNISLDAGEFQDIETAEVFWAKSSTPFGLIHFMTSGTSTQIPSPGLDPYDCANSIATPGDPALEWAYPRGNWLNRYVFPVGPTTAGTWCNDHITVVAPLADWAGITLDGNALPAATAIAQSGHGFAYVPVPNPFHELEAPTNVGVEVSVYGVVGHGSYFYPGGMGLQILNPEG